MEKVLTAKAEGGLGGHGRSSGGVGDLTRNLLSVVHPRDLQDGSNPSHAIFALIFYRRHFLSCLVQPVCDGDGATLSEEAEGEDACMCSLVEELPYQSEEREMYVVHVFERKTALTKVRWCPEKPLDVECFTLKKLATL